MWGAAMTRGRGWEETAARLDDSWQGERYMGGGGAPVGADQQYGSADELLDLLLAEDALCVPRWPRGRLVHQNCHNYCLRPPMRLFLS